MVREKRSTDEQMVSNAGHKMPNILMIQVVAQNSPVAISNSRSGSHAPH